MIAAYLPREAPLRRMKFCFPLLAGIVWLLAGASAVSALDLEVELCSKADPKDRISGILVERTKGSGPSSRAAGARRSMRMNSSPARRR